MAFSAALSRLNDYRKNHAKALVGTKRMSWFTSDSSDIKSLLEDFKSDDENSEISGKYRTGKMVERIPGHIKLNYVCGMRREIRKQFVSGEGDICTDVTPFRHGVISAVGAHMFDNALEQILDKGGK